MNALTPIAILISGRGSNMKAIVDACETGVISARPVLIFSDKADAAGLDYAREKNIPVHTLSRKGFTSREAYDAETADIIASYNPSFICFAGYMRLVTSAFISRFTDRIINIHPSLLPSFKGLNAQQQAIDAGVKVTGCTVHIVREEMDAGPILVQQTVPVEENDTAQSLAERLLEKEHSAYIEALRLCCDNKIRIEGNHAYVSSS